MDKHELLEKVRVWSAVNRKTRQDIADLLGVSKRTIDGWYSGRNICERQANALLSIIKEKHEEGFFCISLQYKPKKLDSMCWKHGSKSAFLNALEEYVGSELYDEALVIAMERGCYKL